MRITPRQYAMALYAALHDRPETEADAILTRFAELLIRQRAKRIASILQAFATVYEAREGVRTVTVDSAVPLAAAERSWLQGHLGAILKTPVALHVRTDRSLLGGAVFQIGDERLDASVRGRLRRARALLAR